jgi:hypothetical protein
MRGITFPLGPLGVSVYCTNRCVGIAIGIRRRL